MKQIHAYLPLRLLPQPAQMIPGYCGKGGTTVSFAASQTRLVLLQGVVL